MSISTRKQKFLTRGLTSLIMAAVIIPTYFIAGGRYLSWVLRFGFLIAMIEFATVVCESYVLPLHANEYGATSLIFVELLVCLIGLDRISVKLLGGCIFVCACTDVAAYLMGTFSGGLLFKKRPFPKASPNKSFEGLLFGLSCGVISAFVLALLAESAGEPVAFWRLAIAAPISVIGALVESYFKRVYGVKDSNDYLIDAPILKWPERLLGGRNGHGGYLDRLDSLALVITLQLLIP